MDLKTATLLAAITQSLAVAGYVLSYVNLLGKLSWHTNPEYVLLQPIYLLSHIMLAVFLFAFYRRQKS